MALTPAFYFALRTEHRENLLRQDLMLATFKSLVANVNRTGGEPVTASNMLTFPVQGHKQSDYWEYETPEQLAKIVAYERAKAMKLKEIMQKGRGR